MKPSLAPLQFLFLVFAGWVNREQEAVIAYLREENAVLREQLGKRRLRLTNAQRRRMAVKGRALGRKVLAGVAGIVAPDTILRWYRELVAKKYDGSMRRGPGRPRTKEDIVELVLTMARANPRWGYTRLRGALHHLGHDIGRNTIKRILLDHCLEPAPERGKRMTWATFLKTHWDAIAAADFFTVEVLTLFGLVRYWVFFVIELKTRMVVVGGITADPHGGWMLQIGRNLTDCDDGFLRDTRHLILDRDPLYTAAFRQLLKDSGCKIVRLPPRSPDLNAHAERFVLSIKSECLSRMVPLGEEHLRRAVREYVAHYHSERHHQGLGNRLIAPANTDAVVGTGPVRRRERLGGLLSFYYREAA
jgi:putative transposase